MNLARRSANWLTNQFTNFPNSTGMEVIACYGLEPGAKFDPSRPPVILLHELPGLTSDCLSLATNLADRGFTVYIPLMFGKVNATGGTWEIAGNMIYLLFSPRWHAFREAETSPIVGELSALIADVGRTNASRPVGVIGMCLTGGVALALLTNKSVRAVVMSQPAVPLIELTSTQKAALGLSPADLSFASNRVARENIPVLGLRFETDRICQAPRFDTLQRVFGGNFSDGTITLSQYDDKLKHRIAATGRQPHSVLGMWYDNSPDSVTRKRFEMVIQYLDKQLR